MEWCYSSSAVVLVCAVLCCVALLQAGQGVCWAVLCYCCCGATVTQCVLALVQRRLVSLLDTVSLMLVGCVVSWRTLFPSATATRIELNAVTEWKHFD